MFVVEDRPKQGAPSVPESISVSRAIALRRRGDSHSMPEMLVHFGPFKQLLQFGIFAHAPVRGNASLPGRF